MEFLSYIFLWNYSIKGQNTNRCKPARHIAFVFRRKVYFFSTTFYLSVIKLEGLFHVNYLTLHWAANMALFIIFINFKLTIIALIHPRVFMEPDISFYMLPFSFEPISIDKTYCAPAKKVTCVHAKIFYSAKVLETFSFYIFAEWKTFEILQ